MFRTMLKFKIHRATVTQADPRRNRIVELGDDPAAAVTDDLVRGDRTAPVG
jgi:aspartate 1-decarboxylase